MLKIGDRAPDFKAMTTKGREVTLADFAGKYLVLYFYPAAFTMGCTIETKLFRDKLPEIRALGGEVVGVSADELDKQCDFANTHGEGLELIADPSKTILAAYDIVDRTALLVKSRRATYIIDPKGVIADINEHNIMVTKSVSDVIASLKKFR